MSLQRDRALSFLTQDPLGNANLISQLLHTDPLRVNLFCDEQGEPRGVILIEPLIEGEQSDVLVQLETQSPEGVRALLRFLRASDRVRIEVHRPWMVEFFASSTNWRPTGGTILTFALHPSVALPDVDPNVVQLTARHAAHLTNEPLSWAPSTLRRYLQEGRRAFAYQLDGRLVARAVSGLPSVHTEEITAVYTAPDYRGRNLGRAVVVALAADIRSWRRVPTYVTTADNEPSLRLVQSLGFKLINTAQVFERLAPDGF